MQIRMFTGNGINVAANKTAQAKVQPAQNAGSMFGAQCRVTISREGRKLSEQKGAHAAQSAQSIKAEKLLLRQQEQTAGTDDAKNEYLELLEEIDSKINAISHSYASGEDDETVLKKQQLIKAMREQKQKQLEENQRNAKEAQQLAMQSSEFQQEIDDNNRDLLIMLESIRESEKCEEEREKSRNGDSEGAQTENKADTEGGVGDVIKNAAAHFGAASARREMDVTGMIRALGEDGHNYIAKADAIVRGAADELANIQDALASDDFSEDEKKQIVLNYHEKMMADRGGFNQYRHSGIQEIKDARRRGIQEIKDARECRIKHIADNPLQGVEETKKSMLQSAVDAAVNEASQGKLEETSEELEDKVEELIDERNDVSHSEVEEEEEQEQLASNEEDAETEDEESREVKHKE